MELNSQMTNQKKPREFQIYKTVSDDETIWSAVEDRGDYPSMIHVIEFSAYSDLLKLAREMRDALKMIANTYGAVQESGLVKLNADDANFFSRIAKFETKRASEILGSGDE